MASHLVSHSHITHTYWFLTLGMDNSLLNLVFIPFSERVGSCPTIIFLFHSKLTAGTLFAMLLPI